ncbi:MAG: bifunctional (p)ppGpp synthetase/guanosine-3',5'-bis(diphosphate) 3'-pyrophosphohydrolase [Desulfovibrio sp.]|jgi:GTP pyrophosphokinase|nr:bifunctional (p)ppGpp synthetase/guanosine-3',5'-bis(diphosphate) 3'-pyrophosphohydrolase [Desulfovibrio sp.]
MIGIQEIMDKMGEFHGPEQLEPVRKAYAYAEAAHTGQMRRSGQPYLSHPTSVAYSLASMRMDGATVAAGLLHDTVEDTGVTLGDLEENFGKDVAGLVDGVTKISMLNFDSKEERQAENIRKMILAMNDDLRVLFVKLADRLHNMRTLEYLSAERRRGIARETMDIYAPLANRLGLHRVKLELEDLSFRYLHPDAYSHITEWIAKNRAADAEYIQEVIRTMRKILEKNGITARLKGRIKQIYSIYRKMHAQSLSLDEMHDIVAFRAIVKDVKDCYAVLGLVHAAWKPVPGRFKDYISMPKANMYQSLHTTVVGPKGERMEIQIRSEAMDNLAENGVASHWLYKEGGRIKAGDIREFNWLREILDWTKLESDSREFMRSLRFGLFKDEIYVFTPKGRVLELPENATAVDFAYQVHTEVGNRCAGGKVNGKLVPLSTPLKSGDTVEIITAANRRPSRDWLKFVKTAKARTRIQHFIRTEEKARSISLGRELLEKQGRRLGFSVSKAVRDGSLLKAALELNFRDVDGLFSAVGYARLTPRKILNVLLPKPEEKREEDKTQAALEGAGRPPKTDEKSDAVVIKGVDDMLVRFAGCCNPVPGDAVIGYISRGRGVAVHTADCPMVSRMEPERLISVYWAGSGEAQPFPARIRVLCKNERGTLAKIAGVMELSGVNIDSGSFRSNVDGRTELEMLIEVADIAQLLLTIDRLHKLDTVLEVARITAGGADTH